MRLIARPWNRLLKAVDWLQSAEEPPLADDERLVLHGLAVRMEGAFPPAGSLILTTRRLVFKPYRYRFLPAWIFRPKWLYGSYQSWEIEVGTISSVSRRSWL